MKMLQQLAIGAIIVAETICSMSGANANGKVSKMQVSLTIENACSVATHYGERNSAQLVSDLGHAADVAVNCTASATSYDVTLDTKTALGEPLRAHWSKQCAATRRPTARRPPRRTRPRRFR